MFFLLSKLFWIIAQPLALLTLLFALGVMLLWLRRPRAGRLVVTAATILLAGLSMLPVGDWAIAPLERRFPVYADDGAPVHGIIVLGGGIDLFATRSSGVFALNDAAERLTAMTALARRYPEARIIFTGGSGSLFFQDAREADRVPDFLREQGIDPARVVIDRASRNTWENAVFTRRLGGGAPGERWLLVTSAFHMARSVGCFRRVGAEIVPYPVDFRVGTPRADLAGNLQRLSLAIREWIGLAAYRLTGRTDALFPAPA